VGPSPRVRGWPAAFGGDVEARRFAPHVAVRLLRTRRPTPKEHDSWARAPRARGWATLARVGRDLLRRLGASVGESFFMLLLEELGLEHQHFTPCFILQATIIAYLCKMFMGATLLPPAFGGMGVAQRPSRGRRRAELRLHFLRELHQHPMVPHHELV
jgi:hypothetical protein